MAFLQCLSVWAAAHRQRSSSVHITEELKKTFVILLTPQGVEPIGMSSQTKEGPRAASLAPSAVFSLAEIALVDYYVWTHPGWIEEVSAHGDHYLPRP